MRVELLVLLVAHIAVGTTLALLSRRYFTKSLRDYYTASSRLGALLSAGTYAATTYSAFMMVGLVGMTYATGIGALGFELLYLAATVVILSTIGYEIWRLARRYQWLAPSQMLGDLYNSRVLAVATALVYLFAMVPYLAAQIRGLEAMFSYGGLGSLEAILISATLVYSWIFIAGMWSVALTDTYQGFLMLSGGLAYLIWALFYLAPARGLTLSDVFTELSKTGHLGLTGFWSLSTFIAYTLPWAFFAITNPQVVIRLYVPRDEEAYKKSVVAFYIYGFLYTLIVVLVGLVAAGLAATGALPRGLGWDSVTPYLLGLMHPLLGSLIAVSVIAAAVSTANSIVLAVSSSLVSLSEKKSLAVARAVDAALVVAATLVAMLGAGFIVELSVLTSVILLPLAPITVLGVYRQPRNSTVMRRFALASLVVGVGLATYYATVLGPRRAFREVVAGLPLSAWVLLVSTLILVTGHLVESKLAGSRRALRARPPG
ncbi:MAG: sodium:solute symporter family protein [Desulfurococcaceae archaeon]|nr:sodium:solute symporter family protein [Desulfurococcaceae archaeon]